ncbi:MAG: cytochrome P460 family protein [Acidobacteriota bacterium]
MKKRVFIFSLLVSLFLAIFFLSLPETHSIESANVALQAPEITGYRKWHRVTDKPVKLDAQIAVMCAPASAAKLNISLHAEKYINVFVNNTGKQILLNDWSASFPQGSMIVKEKMPDATTTQPELLTAMIKREAGFNPPSNDWEFLVLSGDGKQVIERGNLQKCITCHLAVRQQDLVYRNYLKTVRIR